MVLHGTYRAALIQSFILAVIGLSLVVVTGYAGQISLAQLTLAGVAGFLLSTIGGSWGIPFPIAPVLAALGATVLGVLVGLPALRIRGLLVGVVTLTFAVAVETIWFQNPSLSGGSGGKPIPTPKLFGIDLGIGTGDAFPRLSFGILALVVLVLVACFVAKLRTSRLGSAMLAVRANERAAAATGINVVRVKLVAFAIGAFIAGLGGTLIAYKQENVTFDAFFSLVGLVMFGTVYLAGITSVSGGIVSGLIGAGGILFISLNHAVTIGAWYGIVAGLGVILTVIFNPEGLVGPIHSKLEERRQRAAVERSGEVRISAALQPLDLTTTDARGAEAEGAILEIAGLTVNYGGVVAIDDVNISVGEGRIVGLIGPNGAGKTTTMDALCGFTTSRGSFHLAGTELTHMKPHRRAALGLGRTFQGVDLYEDLTVEENILAGQHSARGGGNDQLLAITDALGLTPLLDQGVGSLSQGQRQLVSVGRALAAEPRVLLLDEPAAGLDSIESIWLADRLRAVRDIGVTIVLIDHDMSLVLGVCDEIHVLDFGRLIASGSPDSIRADRRVAEAYLGVTHASTLSAAEQEASSS